MNNLLKQQYIGLIECNNEEISILANTSAFIMQNFDDISWAGFYLLKNEELRSLPRENCLHKYSTY